MIPNVSSPFLQIDRSTYQDDTTGRLLLRLTPVLRRPPGFPCISGELTFAFWEVWEDEPETHAAAEVMARKNAATVLAAIAKEVQA